MHIFENKHLVERIDNAIRLCLLFLIAFLPFSKSAIEIFFFIIFFLWVAKHIVIKSVKIEPTPINIPIVLFIVAAIISVFRSMYFKESLYAFFSKFMEGIVLYTITAEVVKKKKHLLAILALLFIATVVTSFDGIIQYYFTKLDLFRQRSMPPVRIGATAAFNHPNDLGGYLIFPILLVSSMVLNALKSLKDIYKDKTSLVKSIGLVALFLLFIFVMFLTKSRAAWTGLIFGFLLLTYFFSRKKTFFGIVLLICLVIVLCSVFLPEGALRVLRLESINVGGSISDRTENWNDTIYMIKKRPVFGWGLNTYMRVFQNYRSDLKSLPTYAHNCYLQMAQEMGLFGVLVFLWVIFSYFRTIIQTVKRKPESAIYYIGISSGMLGFLIHSFFDTNLYSLQLNVLFWFMLALSMARLEE